MQAPTAAETLRADLPASLVVFLVATPLCLGIALASGAPLFAGIIAGIVGGIVVGAASGSALGVSGPAAGLAVIVFTAIQTLGSWEAFLLSVVIAGALQMGLGFARAGVIGYYFPSSVIKGMLTGIGLTIILKQLPHAVGYDADPEGNMSFAATAGGDNTFSAVAHMFSFIQPGALVVALVSLAILVLWERPFIKKMKASLWIQGPLVAVATGVALNAFFKASAAGLEIEPSHLVQIPVATSVAGFLGLFTMPDFSQVGNPIIYSTALTIAVVASLETLLCVEATDRLDPYKRVTPTDRELKAQGLGNMISGLIGGLPVTQVIVRSSANIQSGARSKLSAILHGVLLLIAVLAAARRAQPDSPGHAGRHPAAGWLQAGQAGAVRVDVQARLVPVRALHGDRHRHPDDGPAGRHRARHGGRGLLLVADELSQPVLRGRPAAQAG